MSVVVSIIQSNETTFPVNEWTTAEDICIECCKKLSIGPYGFHLFALRRRETNIFLSPNHTMQQETSGSKNSVFEFRLRLWPVLDKLAGNKTGAEESSKSVLDYFFSQVSEDFAQGCISELHEDSLKKVALGLGVASMYCKMVEKSLTMQQVLSVYKKFLPKVVRKRTNLRLSQDPLRNKLKETEANPPDLWFCKLSFIKQVEEIAQEYTREAYLGQVDQDGSIQEYYLIIDTCDPVNPGLKRQHARKKYATEFICSIEELLMISARSDCTVEISRTNGVPFYFKFYSLPELHSCISALNGYYRLSEKWTFDLCLELGSPLVSNLRNLKCHGPVDEEFSYSKLRSKRRFQQGSYILRQSRDAFDEYYLDACLEQGKTPLTFLIRKNENGEYFFDRFSRTYSSLPELLASHSEATEGQLKLKERLPQSENDLTDLLLCRRRPLSDPESAKETALQLPVCIPPDAVSLVKRIGSIAEGNFTVVQHALWRKGNQTIEVARKSLKVQYQETHYKEFWESLQKSIFCHCETIVSFHGLLFSSPVSLVMEYFPLGPLDEYLQESRERIEEIDLIEASSSLAKALWYLEGKSYVHGKIRCRNVFVSFHSESSFRVKLSDPGINSLSEEDLPWIPVEFYMNVKDAARYSVTDIWAFGTTLWEIFSYGEKPLSRQPLSKIRLAVMDGCVFVKPKKCPAEIYKLMKASWNPDPHQRPRAHALLRDINQLLYEVFNGRRTNTYAAVNNHCFTLDQSTLSTEVLDERQDSISSNDFAGSIDVDDIDFDSDEESITGNMYVINSAKLQLGQVLGRGNYGEVKIGVIVHSDGEQETVAVKCLKSSAFSSPESEKELQTECDIMRELQHPNIVEVKAVVSDVRTMLVMEYVPLGSLLSYLHKKRDMVTTEQLLKFASDVAEGMEYLGQKNIVHRDLAARNILVASDDLVKISDFGLARDIGDRGFYVVQANRQQLPMTWYAPESLENFIFTVKSDVWSYGVTLYEMFSRGAEPKLVSGDHLLLLQALKQGKRLPCPELCPSSVYRDLMYPCWKDQPNQRPTFSAILHTINHLQSHV